MYFAPKEMSKKHLDVVAAIIFHDDQILCVQRNKHRLEYISEKFEFPGGKIENGESKKTALEREIQEELSLNLIVHDEFITVDHEYPDFAITMTCFKCTTDNRSFKLHEHIDAKWLHISELNDLDWAAADIPIVNKLIREA